jgi:hypothetical protein
MHRLAEVDEENERAISVIRNQAAVAGTAASAVINRYPCPSYNRNRRESNADERDSPTLIPDE